MYPDPRKNSTLAFPSGLLINEREGLCWRRGCPGAGKVPRRSLSLRSSLGLSGRGDLPTSAGDRQVGKRDGDRTAKWKMQKGEFTTRTVLSWHCLFVFLLNDHPKLKSKTAINTEMKRAGSSPRPSTLMSERQKSPILQDESGVEISSLTALDQTPGHNSSPDSTEEQGD